MTDNCFSSGSEYTVPLLRLMAHVPEGGCKRRQDVLQDFEAEYGARIPPAAKELVPGAGATKLWYSYINGASAPLFQRGFLEKTGRGEWSITEQGRSWLAEHPDATRLGGRGPSGSGTRSEDVPTDAELLAAVRLPLQQINDYLRGRNTERPTGERLCDWIHFCYELGLHRKAVDLWPFVHKEQIHPWHFERTEKIVRACRARLG